MRRKKHAKIADTDLYDIKELINIWNSGWQNLARLEVVNKDVVIWGFGSDHEDPIKQAILGFYEIVKANAEIWDVTIKKGEVV